MSNKTVWLMRQCNERGEEFGKPVLFATRGKALKGMWKMVRERIGHAYRTEITEKQESKRLEVEGGVGLRPFIRLVATEERLH